MAEEAMVVENAPLGVRAGVAAGCFTVAVATGPVPPEAFEKEGAHLIVGSMEEFAFMLKSVTSLEQDRTNHKGLEMFRRRHDAQGVRGYGHECGQARDAVVCRSGTFNR